MHGHARRRRGRRRLSSHPSRSRPRKAGSPVCIPTAVTNTHPPPPARLRTIMQVCSMAPWLFFLSFSPRKPSRPPSTTHAAAAAMVARMISPRHRSAALIQRVGTQTDATQCQRVAEGRSGENRLNLYMCYHLSPTVMYWWPNVVLSVL